MIEIQAWYYHSTYWSGVSLNIDNKKIDFLTKNIRAWFKEHGRNYPWRSDNLTDYEVTLSEVLLQRTRADTILHYYPKFLQMYPNWLSLSQTTKDNLQEVLQPIGLSNNKASALIGLSRAVVERGSKMPPNRKELEALPGIGHYTASAVLSICHGAREPLLDSNMARLLQRYYGIPRCSDIRHDSTLQNLARESLPRRRIKQFNWAILDFAAIVCKPQKPRCADCILQRKCVYFQLP